MVRPDTPKKGAWCAHHDANLTAAEKRSIVEHNKRKGKSPAVVGTIKKKAPAKPKIIKKTAVKKAKKK